MEPAIIKIYLITQIPHEIWVDVLPRDNPIQSTFAYTFIALLIIGSFSGFFGGKNTNLNLNEFNDDLIISTNSHANLNQIIGLESDQGSQIRSAIYDQQNNLYIIGAFTNQITFDQEIYESNISGDYGWSTGFVAKMNVEGNFEWVIVADGTGLSNFEHLTTDSNGNIYISGYHKGILSLGEQSIDRGEAGNPIYYFVAKISPEGDCMWLNGAPQDSRWRELSVDSNNDVWVLGSSLESVYIGDEYIDTGNGPGAIYFAKLNTLGDWVQVYSIPLDDDASENARPGFTRMTSTSEGRTVFGHISESANLTVGNQVMACDYFYCPFAISLSNNGELRLNEFSFNFIQDHIVIPYDALMLENGNILVAGELMTNSTVAMGRQSSSLWTDNICPIIVEYSTNGSVVNYLTCSVLGQSNLHSILKIAEFSDGSIIFTGVTYGEDMFDFGGQSVESEENKKLWFGKVSSDFEMEWSMNSFKGHGGAILDNGDFGFTIVGTIRESTNFGLQSSFEWENYDQGFILQITNMDDIDADGIDLSLDNCPAGEPGWISNITTDYDQDGCRDASEDLDDDNDGCSDSGDAFPYDQTECPDTDSDGIGNNQDDDDDGDGVLDLQDSFPLDASAWNDTDGDGLPDELNRSIATELTLDLDIDNDGRLNENDTFPFDPSEWNDLDSDGYGDNSDDCIGNYGTSTIDRLGCIDQDSDGISDLNDEFPFDANETMDTDKDGVEDNSDAISSNEGSQSATDLLFNVILVLVSLGIALVTILKVVSKLRSDDEDWDDEDFDYYEAKSETKKKSPKREFIHPSIQSQQTFVNTWEELPEGEWLDNDEQGTHWYLDNDGNHWHSTDDGYTMYNKSD